MDGFPKEIMDHIYEYIPIRFLLFVRKSIYIQNHSLIKTIIPRNQYENYIRDMIRRDNHFVFAQLMRENAEHWLLMKKYSYKRTIFSNYIYFLLDYCIENESDHCKRILQNYLKESGLSKNQHKKNIHTNIKWTN